MLNHDFLNTFSRNFINQIKHVCPIDGYLTYNIDNIFHAYNFDVYGIPNSSIDEYLNVQIEHDPVSFRHFYHQKNNVAVLDHYQPNEVYRDFMKRWQVSDTAEFFFRKRNGEPIFGISIFRSPDKENFNTLEQKIFESFHTLSESYFHHHADVIDKNLFIDQYNLTKKEIVVLEELFSGLEGNYIAQKLNCSLATVKTHVQHIYQKTNVKNRQELLCKFLR
ncbi:helix-turn-helix transcriptional regulator [Acinetobacter stercoris]|uniref:Transcriptional regulator MalT n=1 Tax=Acinetobacter stercoris TaxID=2126983 RepID=A0A2U3N4Q0_9GAMM|nr:MULTISPECIES: helix-turn-helix transcriptional regulator [Acinetobacter]SPL72658.1 transcriptional regulator MalT [Acinetobacter stercoris]